MKDKLKPCPFCGGEATYWLNNVGGISVGCLTSYRGIDHPRCPVEPIVTTFRRDVETAKEEAIEAWNKRPNHWHTGTPAEEGWYLIKYECLVEGRYKGKLTYRAVHKYYDKYGIYNEDGSIGKDEVWKPIEYQIIEQNKETD